MHAILDEAIVTTAPDRLTVAAAQYPLDALPDLEAWADKTARWISEGAASSARLLVLPEYGAIEIAAACGAEVCEDLHRTLTAVADHAEATHAVWSRLASQHDVFILASSGPEHRDGRFVNAARLFGPGGGVGVQEKLILTPFETDWGMSPGSGQRVFDTPIGRIGVAICYDAEFPLLVRGLAEAGTEIVVVPSCTEFMSGFHRVRNSAMARALENQIATVMSPTVGEAIWSPAIDRNSGAAGVYVPPDVGLSMNGVLAEGTLNEPGWVAAEINLAGLRQLRESGEMRNWRDWSRQPGAAPLGDGIEVIAVS